MLLLVLSLVNLLYVTSSCLTTAITRHFHHQQLLIGSHDSTHHAVKPAANMLECSTTTGCPTAATLAKLLLVSCGEFHILKRHIFFSLFFL